MATDAMTTFEIPGTVYYVVKNMGTGATLYNGKSEWQAASALLPGCHYGKGTDLASANDDYARRVAMCK